MFIKFLEENNQLLRNYTQNIDTLEKVAGIENVVECHGTISYSITFIWSEIQKLKVHFHVLLALTARRKLIQKKYEPKSC